MAAEAVAISPEWTTDEQELARRAVAIWCEQSGQCVSVRVGEAEPWEATLRPGTLEECTPLELAGRVYFSSRRPPDVWVCRGYPWLLSVMVHEMGHALLPDLRHTEDPEGVMYPDLVREPPVDLAASDLDAVSDALD